MALVTGQVEVNLPRKIEKDRERRMVNNEFSFYLLAVFLCKLHMMVNLKNKSKSKTKFGISHLRKA